ncbi:MAG: hypothetical protein ACI3ZW_12215 [Parabacteroides sp.]
MDSGCSLVWQGSLAAWERGFWRIYTLFPDTVKPSCLESIRYLLSKNIIIGDALNYHRVDRPEEWIVISEWRIAPTTPMCSTASPT